MFRKVPAGVIIVLLSFASLARADLIDGEDFIDPTQPLFYVANSDIDVVDEIFRTVVPASYDISFIRAGGDSSTAVINNVRVSIGDIIGGAEVLLIDREGVTLLIDDEERRINMYESRIKSTQ
ncbi:MAG: hypothetical protein ACI80L_001546 [Pseudohongiellaceae bacterium]